MRVLTYYNIETDILFGESDRGNYGMDGANDFAKSSLELLYFGTNGGLGADLIISELAEGLRKKIIVHAQSICAFSND